MPLKSRLIRWTMEYAPGKVRAWIASKTLGDYGKMVEIKFDPDKKHLYAKLELSGEKEPVTVEIDDYEMEENDEKSIILVKSAKVDRKWIDLLVNDLIVGKPIEVPGDKFKMIRDILKA